MFRVTAVRVIIGFIFELGLRQKSGPPRCMAYMPLKHLALAVQIDR